MTFLNSLYPDQAQQIVGPDLDSNCLTLMVQLKEFLEKKWEKNQLLQKNHGKLPSMQRVIAAQNYIYQENDDWVQSALLCNCQILVLLFCASLLRIFADYTLQGLLGVTIWLCYVHRSRKTEFLCVKLLIFSYQSVLRYVLGAQKNRLIETVLLSTHNICFG